MQYVKEKKYILNDKLSCLQNPVPMYIQDLWGSRIAVLARLRISAQFSFLSSFFKCTSPTHQDQSYITSIINRLNMKLFLSFSLSWFFICFGHENILKIPVKIGYLGKIAEILILTTAKVQFSFECLYYLAAMT